MPAKSVSGIDPEEGPAIQMKPEDHRQTGSHGSKGAEGYAYREQIRDLIQQGRMRDAMALEVKNVRSIADKIYNQAIREMLDYAKKTGWLNK